KQQRDLRLVGLQLIIRLAQGSLFIRDVFEFQYRQWDAIDEHHHVCAAVKLSFLNSELVNREKFVVLWSDEIDQPDLVVNDLAVAVAKLHVNAFDEQPM